VDAPEDGVMETPKRVGQGKSKLLNNAVIVGILLRNTYYLFNKGFTSSMNIAKSDRVQLQITRYAYSLFLSPTAFNKSPIFYLMPSLFFTYVSTGFTAIISVIVRDNKVYFVLLVTLISKQQEICPTVMMLIA
jgi:hypothetical protein